MKMWANSLHCVGEIPASIPWERGQERKVGVAEAGVPPTSLWELPTPYPKVPASQPPSPPRPLVWLNLTEKRPNLPEITSVQSLGEEILHLGKLGPGGDLGGAGPS